MPRVIGHAAETVDGELVVPVWLVQLDGVGDAMAWEKQAFTFEDFAAAAMANDVPLLTLRARELAEGVVIQLTETADGGTIASYVVSVGITGDEDRYSPSGFDCMAAVGTFELFSGEYLESLEDDTEVNVYAVTTGDDLDNATAGAVAIWFRRNRLPE